MEIPQVKLKLSKKLLAIFYSLLIVIPIYSILISIYFFDFINSFVLLISLFAVMIIALIPLIIFRKNKFKSLVVALTCLFTFLFICYEFLLLDYESHTYNVSGYWEPEEVLKGSGIHILAVGSYDVYFNKDEDSIKKDFEEDGIQIFDLHKIKNRDRCQSKRNDTIQFFGFQQNDFHTMSENVKDYIGEDIPLIDEFLKQEKYEGDSAGLALGLTAKILQGKLENTVPIGVTGALESNGNVIEIGSIKEKMMIAEEKGFPVIIIPFENLAEAEIVKDEQKSTIKIIPVHHVDEAIEAIKKLNN